VATGNCKVPRDKQPQFGVKLYEEDVRLIYNAVEFYHKNRPASSERPEYMQEPTKHLEYMKQSMMTMIMECSFQQNK
jgi:hypothetical protein